MRLFSSCGLSLAAACVLSALCFAQGKIDITCEPLEKNQIDWDCIFGPESLEEVHERGGKFTTCKDTTGRPCSRFIVKKEKERSEVKVQEGPDGFPFLKNEKYIFRYSFRAVEGMKVATRFTHLGQIKGSKGGYMIKGDPLYSLTANKYGLMVRFSNLDTIEDFHPGLDEYLPWEEATGDWVHVKIVTVFGKSMKVKLSGAVKGKAVWPKDLKPVAWHEDAEMARMKLGLYHAKGKVADGEVEYRDISIEGPNGIIRTSPDGDDSDDGDEDKGDDGDGENEDPGEGTCTAGKCDIDITCNALDGNQIDWDCVFGPESLEEVHERGGQFTTCRDKSGKSPCSRFIVKKEKERSEVKVQEGPDGFPFLKNEKYIFKYSFRAVEDMKVATRFTHLGQIKGSKDGYMIKGDPLYSLTANKYGLMVRFSNLDTIEDFHPGMDKYLSWEDVTGDWVHVTITTVFGRSMEVTLSGAVNGKAVWPSNLTPVAWHEDAEMARMKLGLYHAKGKVADGEVEYKDISIQGPNGIIRTTPEGDERPDKKNDGGKDDKEDNGPEEGTCLADGDCDIDITCDALDDNQIDWDCVFGPDSLEEVHQRGGKFTTCRNKNDRPCSRFIVKKEKERSEVKVQEGPDGFPFLKNEKYIFKYSFRAVEGMKVATRFTHLGQIKGSREGYMIKGDPLYSLTANKYGLMVRFSNLDTIEDFHPGMDEYLSWEDVTGDWVHVKITTVFGRSMEVELSGAVKGKAEWPKDLKPVAWHKDAEMARMKLGLYHAKGKVADGEVEYRDISIEGPNGIIRTSPDDFATGGGTGSSSPGDDDDEPRGNLYLGCYKDSSRDRIFKGKFVDAHMTTNMCAVLCAGKKYYGTQYATECWCGDSKSDFDKHGESKRCNMSCAGGGKIGMCGGPLSMSVYEYGGKPEDIPDDTNYLGCFADHPADRALTLAYTSDASKMSHKKCAKTCSKADAEYFGLEYSRECFCGKSSDRYDKHGTATCSMPCTGDSDSVCGGGRALSIFRLED